MMTEWIKKIGLIGLLFFLIKGLIWLAIILIPMFFAME